MGIKPTKNRLCACSGVLDISEGPGKIGKKHEEEEVPLLEQKFTDLDPTLIQTELVEMASRPQEAKALEAEARPRLPWVVSSKE